MFLEVIAIITLTDTQKKLLNDLKNRSSETYSHSLRVKKLTAKMLWLMNSSGEEKFSRRNVDIICKGALLHDIGKLYTRNFVLTKASVLSEMEMAHMKNHTRLGYEAVKDELAEDEQEIIKNILLYHHERVDGSGYERMTDLPLYVQIVSICDVFDALHSDRVYRNGLTREKALQIIREGKSGNFDEKIIKNLEHVTENID